MSDGGRPGDGRCRGLQPRLRRAGPVAVVFVVAGLLAAACGGGSAQARAANHGPKRAANVVSLKAEQFAFAACVRAHGLPKFPNPNPGSGSGWPSGSLNPYYLPRTHGLGPSKTKFGPPKPRPQLESAERACRSLAIASEFES
jgi:hypothetical protein